MLVASVGFQQIQHLKKNLQAEFDMKILGTSKRILGMDIHRNEVKGELFLNQSVEEIQHE